MIEAALYNSLSHIYPDAGPDPSGLTAGGNALTGERHSFQVAYRCSGCFQEGISARTESDLGGAVTLRYVGYIPCDLTVPAGNEDICEHPAPGLMPDVLRPLPPVLWAYSSGWRSLWVTVDTGHPDASPGVHQIDVILSDREETVLRYELEIFEARLPEQELPVTNWFHSDGICNYYNVEFASDEYWRIAGEFVRTAVRSGINTILTPVFTPPLDTAPGHERLTTQLVGVRVNADGSYGFTFDLLDRYIDMCLDAGARYLEISHLFTQWGCRNAPKIVALCPEGAEKRIFGWETDGTGPEYTAFLRAFLPALRAFLEGKGVFEKCFFHVSDEPDLSVREQYSGGSSVVKEFIPADRIIDAMSEPEFYREGLIRVPVASLSSIDRFIGEGIESLWGYYCCGQIRTSNRLLAAPAYRNRILGCQLFRYDIKGFLQWGFNFYNSHMSLESVDPFSSSTGGGWVPGGDPFVVYPGPGGEVWESTRLLVFAEALCDYRALSALLDSGRFGSRGDICSMLGIDKWPFSDFEVTAAELIDMRSRVNRLLAGV